MVYIDVFAGWTSAHDPRKPPTEAQLQRAKVRMLDTSKYLKHINKITNKKVYI